MKKIDQINEKIEKARAKLEEVQKNYEANTKRIEELNKVRASKIADQSLEPSAEGQKEIDSLTKEIDSLKNLIEREGKDLVEAITIRITDFEKEKQEENVQISFIQQKKIGKKIIELSTELIQGLELSNTANIELRKAWGDYSQLSKITKKSVFKKEDITSQGSAEMLNYLTSILKWEIQNKKPRPCIEVGRMKI
jgi:hypothetical protein